MKRWYLLLCLLIAFGCDGPSGTGTDNPANGSSKLKLTNTKPIVLTGGVRWAMGADTLVSYDMSEPIAVKNTSSSTLQVSVFAQLGALIDGAFTNHPDFLSWTDGTLPIYRVDTTLEPGEVVIMYRDFLSLGRCMPLDWRFPYAYRLTYWTGTDTTVVIDTFAGCTPDNRYKGYIRTTTSPVPNGIIDGPDDDDWVSSDSTRLVVQCPFSNPTQVWPPIIRINYMLSQDMDSMHMAIHETDRFVTWELREGSYHKGMWIANLTPTLRKKGLHRFVMKAFRNGEMFMVKGDVMVQ